MKEFKHKVVIPRDEWGRGDCGPRSTPVTPFNGPGCVLVHMRDEIWKDRHLRYYSEIEKALGWPRRTCYHFYTCNDHPGLSDPEREQRLIALAAKHSIDLTFVPTRDYQETPTCEKSRPKTEKESCTNSHSEALTVTC